MILLMKEDISSEQANDLIDQLSSMNLKGVLSHENGRYLIHVVGGIRANTDLKPLSLLPFVDQILPFSPKYKLASHVLKKERTAINIQGRLIGAGNLTVIAGPCSIESEEQIHQIAEIVAASGATILRGGAFKPRTSPYDFQGLGEIGLKYMQSASKKYNLLSVSEVMDTKDIDLVASYVDILQVGARNMQNFSLLKQLGKAGKPILLKRGLCATYSDLLMAAEYILQTGNPNVILCERGIRTFETFARNTLDIAAVPILHELSHLPVIVDPSHGTGIRSIVPAMAYAALAAGADGIMVEMHPEPDCSISDAQQTISPQTFAEMMRVLSAIGEAID